MRRATQGCVLICLFLAATCFGLLVVASLATEGRLLGAAQNLLRRIQLSHRSAELDAPYGSNASPLRFHIAPGASAGEIAAALAEAKLISESQLFVDYALVEGYDRRFEAGVYFLNQTLSIKRIAETLTDSSKSFIPFRSIEGARTEELAELIDRNGLFGFSGADFLDIVRAGAIVPAEFADWAGLPPAASLEGFMFPDTYQLPPEMTAAGLRDTLLRAFRDRVGDDLRAAALAQGFTLYQVVTLASIIEREAVWRDEHPMIASVYRNRLAINMRLEADPTVQYSLHGTRGSWWPPITRADYRGVNSPYNTYLNGGLPPGPIASPGLSAIIAAIHPAESGYFFFRAACDNSHYHVFAVTFDEHLANAC